MVGGGPQFHSGLLVDEFGRPTSVSIDFDSMGSGFNATEFNEPHTQGDDERLLDDVVSVTGLQTITIHGLQSGGYAIYVYAMAPDDPLAFTTVDVQGASDPSATVGGDFSMGYRRNVTHALHHVLVYPLTPDVVISIDLPGSFGPVAGLQLEQQFACICGIGFPYCQAEINSTGVQGQMEAFGSRFVSDNDVTLFAGDLPPFAFGFFLVSQTQAQINHNRRYLRQSLRRRKPRPLRGSGSDP